jgi:hypothetical protein
MHWRRWDESMILFQISLFRYTMPRASWKEEGRALEESVGRICTCTQRTQKSKCLGGVRENLGFIFGGGKVRASRPAWQFKILLPFALAQLRNRLSPPIGRKWNNFKTPPLTFQEGNCHNYEPRLGGSLWDLEPKCTGGNQGTVNPINGQQFIQGNSFPV